MFPNLPAIILFDGVCNLCNSTVDFVLTHEQIPHFHFASLQSVAGQALLRQHGLSSELKSIVVLEDGKLLRESQAVLQIVKYLRQPWRSFRFLGILPAGIRDGLYRWVARNRYRWFGQRQICRLPTPAECARFLSDADPRWQELLQTS